MHAHMTPPIDWLPFSSLTGRDVHDVLQLRERVFVVEQQCPYLDADGADPQCWHGLCRDGATLIATARLVPPGLKYAEPAIGRVVSAPEVRRTGAGRAFCAGGDVEEGNGELTDDIRDARALVRNMIACRKPIVSAINGVAVGGGLAVGLLADIAIVSERAVLIDGHTTIGMVAGDHAALVWPLSMGLARAKYFALTCDRISGPEAAEIGLVAKCVPHDDLLPTAEAIATKLAAGPQLALQATKTALNDWYTQNLSIFEHSLYAEALSMTHPDAAEGLDAVLAKRAPRFPGVTKADVS